MQSKALLPLGVSFVLALAGCGGSEPQPQTGDQAPSASAAMTAEPTAAPVETAAASAAPTAAPSAAPVVEAPKPTITLAALKLTPNKGQKSKPVELKADGTILVDGKPGGKFTASELQDADGKTIATVAADGTITMEGAPAGTKFNDKNEIEADGKPVISIADDGSVKVADAKGKLGAGTFKVEGLTADGRRAAALLASEFFLPKPKATKPAEKPAAKPAGDKPAGGAKPAAGGAKPAPKK
jgi:hypothetical protein